MLTNPRATRLLAVENFRREVYITADIFDDVFLEPLRQKM